LLHALLFLLQAEAPHELVSFSNCFHGRTMGALALTYKEQYKSPFLPVMPGHVLAEYNNLDSAAAVIKKGKTAAVFVEPVQVRGTAEAELQQKCCRCMTDLDTTQQLVLPLVLLNPACDRYVCMQPACCTAQTETSRPPLVTLTHLCNCAS
jgi:acetylornithine/succinyldiaminopimelate/putrescine aminotransferase